MELSNDIAALIGFACEAILWGAYSILFIMAMSFLLWRQSSTGRHWVIIAATCILFAACTSHFAIEFSHYWTTLKATGVKGFANETRKLVGADILISLCDVLGQMVLLYRCWMIWGRNAFIVIIPFVTSIGGLTCIAGVIEILQNIDPTAPVAPPQIIPLGIAGYVLPLVTNIMITLLIMTRIILASRSLPPMPPETSFSISHPASAPSISIAAPTRGSHHLHSHPIDSPARPRAHNRMAARPRVRIPAPPTSMDSAKSHVRAALALVVESAVLYTAVQLLFVVLFALQRPEQAIVAVAAVQIYGIAPTLIVFRVALGASPFDAPRPGLRNANRAPAPATVPSPGTQAYSHRPAGSDARTGATERDEGQKEKGARIFGLGLPFGPFRPAETGTHLTWEVPSHPLSGLSHVSRRSLSSVQNAFGAALGPYSPLETRLTVDIEAQAMQMTDRNRDRHLTGGSKDFELSPVDTSDGHGGFDFGGSGGPGEWEVADHGSL